MNQIDMYSMRYGEVIAFMNYRNGLLVIIQGADKRQNGSEGYPSPHQRQNR